MGSFVFSNAIDLIGQTPMVSLDRLTKNLDGNILVKVEFFNPGFSKKDRIAKWIIEEAEKSGELQQGQTVVELTSGNTGTGLAIVCAVKGYPFVAVMSKGNSVERARMMKALGAEVILVDQKPGGIQGQVSGEDLELVEAKVKLLIEERHAFWADQFHHRGNFLSHYHGTAVEILNQTGGVFDIFLDFAGSGGTYAGCATRFKEFDVHKKCYVVEPYGAAVMAKKKILNASHKIQGGGYSISQLVGITDDIVDGYLEVTENEVVETARRLAREEGLFAGFSSGANVAAALQMLKGVAKGKTIVCTLNDSGLKYLSTDLYD